VSERKTVCALVEDLLPLWRDSLVLAQTAALIEDHLSECPACRALIEAADDFEQQLAATASPMPEGSTDRFLVRLRGRLRRKTQARAAVTGILALASGVASSGVASGRPVTPEQRYQEFLATVPGYLAAEENGGLVPMHTTLRLGSETITLQGFFANYFGSFAIFTAKGQDGHAPIPPQGAKASPSMALWTSPIGEDSIAGYFQLNAVTVVTPIDAKYLRQPASIPLTLTLPAPEAASVSTTITVPKSAYLPHGAIVRKRPMTLRAGGVTVRLESIDLSSAGTLVLGESRGGDFSFQSPAQCPAFLGRACLNWPNWGLQRGSVRTNGWQPFAWVLPGPASRTAVVSRIALALPGLDVQTTLRISARVKWPLDLALGRSSFGDQGLVPLNLGSAGGYTVQLASDASAEGLTVQVASRSRKPPDLVLKGVKVTLPGDASLSATNDGTMTGAGLQQGWLEQFPLNWANLPSSAQLDQQGTATVTVTLETYPSRSLPKGTIWRP
jgi:hypothetical protein